MVGPHESSAFKRLKNMAGVARKLAAADIDILRSVGLGRDRNAE